MGKPRIFISSTIYDFRDLRSALRYWFEEVGLDVKYNTQFFSQHNSSYRCLVSITKLSHYILEYIETDDDSIAYPDLFRADVPKYRPTKEEILQLLKKEVTSEHI